MLTAVACWLILLFLPGDTFLIRDYGLFHRSSKSMARQRFERFAKIAPKNFVDFGLPNWLLEGCAKMNFTTPTDVQTNSIPVSTIANFIFFVFTWLFVGDYEG
jgi:hypothetical protein